MMYLGVWQQKTKIKAKENKEKNQAKTELETDGNAGDCTLNLSSLL